MRGAPCSAAWRLAALLLGASWVVTLVVACGGGDDDPASAATAVQTSPQIPGQSPGQGAATLPGHPPQPCTDALRRPTQPPPVTEPEPAPQAHGDRRDGAAPDSPAGRPRAGASGAAPPADPFESK
jgi:hypothetical protein